MENFKKDIETVAFSFFELSTSSNTMNMSRGIMITSYRESKAMQLHCDNRKYQDYFMYLSLLWGKAQGVNATMGSESTMKQIGRPLDSAVTVFEWGQAGQPGQNKILHRIIIVPVVELTIVLFSNWSGLFANVVLHPHQTRTGGSAWMYLHHKDKTILGSCFHYLCGVHEQWMTERLGWGRLKSGTLWTAEQMHGRTHTSSTSGPNRQALTG